ncbi:MAG: hypothetical protein WCJ35_22545 [Planctomycetota bacterium]
MDSFSDPSGKAPSCARPSAPAFARSASASPPPLDYLSDELSTAFFDAREHEAYYRSLRTSVRPRPIDARRAYYDTFRPVLLRLLALADDDGIVFLEHLITANIREEKRTPGAQARGCAVERVRRVEPKGMTILGNDAGRDPEHCRAAYRAAARRCHPDHGGAIEDMIAVNSAFEMLHRILVEEAGAAPIAGEVDESREFSGDTRNASAYLWTVRQLLLGIALDEWAIEEATVYFEQLVPVQSTRAAEEPEDPERPWFFLGNSPYGEHWERTHDLFEQACRLTMRLCAAGRADGAARSLLIARAFYRQFEELGAIPDKGSEEIRGETAHARRQDAIRHARDLTYGKGEHGNYKQQFPRAQEEAREELEALKQSPVSFMHPSLRKALECVAGTRKPPVVLDGLRQIENAFRLGVIDEKRYKASMSRVTKTAGRVSADRSNRLAIFKRTHFAPLLPADAKLKPSRNVGRMVPYPMAYQPQGLTPDQQAEYLRAFREKDDLDLAARYAGFRLDSVFQSAILFTDSCNLASLAEEADAIAQIQPDCRFAGGADAVIIRLIAELGGTQRGEFVSQLAKLLRRGLVYCTSEPMWKLAKKFAETTAAANKFHAHLHDLLVAIANYCEDHPSTSTISGWDDQRLDNLRRLMPLAAYEREHPSTRLVGEPTAMVLDRAAVPDDTAAGQLAVERQRQLPLSINGVDDKDARPQGADMSPADLPPALRDRLRESHNAMVAAVEECFGPDSPLIQELGGYEK